MGWSEVCQGGAQPLLDCIVDGERFYFVHSYFVEPADDSLSAAKTDYGVRFTSAVARANIFAVQFHPEKNKFESKVNVDRSKQTLKLMDKFAKFFCDKLIGEADEEELLRAEQKLQKYSVYVGSNIGVFDEVYIFQKDN